MQVNEQSVAFIAMIVVSTEKSIQYSGKIPVTKLCILIEGIAARGINEQLLNLISLHILSFELISFFL